MIATWFIEIPSCCSIASRQLPQSIEILLLWTPLDRSWIALQQLKSAFIILDTSQHISICWELWSFYIKVPRNFRSLLLDLSRYLLAFSPSKLFSLTPNFIPKSFSTLILFFFTGKVFNPSLYHAFHSFWPNFWDFWKFLRFSKLMKFLWNFWDGCCLNEFKTSCIASHLHYNNVPCI